MDVEVKGRIAGVGASEGVAVGPAFVHARGELEPERKNISESEVEEARGWEARGARLILFSATALLDGELKAGRVRTVTGRGKRSHSANRRQRGQPSKEGHMTSTEHRVARNRARMPTGKGRRVLEMDIFVDRVVPRDGADTSDHRFGSGDRNRRS